MQRIMNPPVLTPRLTVATVAPPPVPPPFVFYKFNASLTIIIAVLVIAFFFMGMVALYVWRCSTDDDLEAALQAAGVIRRPSSTTIAASTTIKPPPSQGLDKASIEQHFPVTFYDSGKTSGGPEEECAVCLGEFEHGDKIRLLHKCEHSFHARCIDTWLASHPSCPICRCNLLKYALPAAPDHVVVAIDHTSSS